MQLGLVILGEIVQARDSALGKIVQAGRLGVSGVHGFGMSLSRPIHIHHQAHAYVSHDVPHGWSPMLTEIRRGHRS